MTIQEAPPSSDFCRIEDIAAEALRAGRRAARALARLDLGPPMSAGRLRHFVGLLSSEKLFEPLALAELTELEADLHILVEREAHYVTAFGSFEAEVEIRPDRCLSEAGRILEDIRSDVAEALDRAWHTIDLATAERIVGRARDLMSRA